MELKTKVLTILVPCYNAEKYISRCFSCLHELSSQDINLLFVNDGSIDSTKQMIEEWVKCHDNASIINKNNGGYSTAINAGLDHCDTEYVMFMGVDDEIIPEQIMKICTHLQKNKPDILFFGTEKVYDDEEDEREKDSLTHYRYPGYYNMDVFVLCEKIQTDAGIVFMRDTSRCFKMSVIDSIRYFGNTGVSADGCFSSLVACHANSFEFLNDISYLWHVHHDSVSSRKKTKEKIIEEIEVWKQYFIELRNCITGKRIPDPLVNHYFVYLRAIDRLTAMNEGMIAHSYKTTAVTEANWLRKNTTLSMKNRLKMACPRLYMEIRNIKRKRAVK